MLFRYKRTYLTSFIREDTRTLHQFINAFRKTLSSGHNHFCIYTIENFSQIIFHFKFQTSQNWFSCNPFISNFKTNCFVKHSSFLFNFNKHLYPTSKVLNVYTIYRHRKKYNLHNFHNFPFCPSTTW